MPRTRCQRLPAAAVLLLAVAFLLIHPAAEERIFRLPSLSARWVSRHHRLGHRLPTLAARDDFRNLAIAAGFREKDLDALRDDPSTRFWWRQVLGDDGLVSVEPFLGADASQGLVLVGRVGWRQAPLRLWSELIGFTSWKPDGHHGGRRIFSRRKPGRTPWSAALCEGWLIAVRHPDSANALRAALDRFDGLRPSLDQFSPTLLDALKSRPVNSDRGVWTGSALLPAPLYMTRVDDDSALRLRLGGPAVQFLRADPDQRPDSALVARLVGGNALARIPLPPSLSRGGGDLLVLGPPHVWTWGFLGLPGVVWIAPAETREAADVAARHVMEDLYRLSGWEFVPNVGSDGAWTFRPSEKPLALLLSSSQHPAAAYVEGHVVLAGGRRVLERLLRRLPTPEAAFEADQCPPHPAFLYPRRTAETLSPLLTSLTHFLAAPSDQDTKPSAHRMEALLAAARFSPRIRLEITGNNADLVVESLVP